MANGNNKRDLKAYVRFDGSGRVVAGSLVLRKNKPKVGKWHEIQTYECCNEITSTTTTTTIAPTTTTTSTTSEPVPQSVCLSMISNETAIDGTLTITGFDFLNYPIYQGNVQVGTPPMATYPLFEISRSGSFWIILNVSNSTTITQTTGPSIQRNVTLVTNWSNQTTSLTDGACS